MELLSTTIRSMTWYSFLGLSLFATSFIVSIFTGYATEHPLWNLNSTVFYYLFTILASSSLPIIFRTASAIPGTTTDKHNKLRYA